MKMEILTACNLAILLVIWFSHLVSETVTSCYFPDYLEGDYSVQSGIAMQSQVQYTEVHISPDAILPWGFCKKKIGSNLYLIENLSNSSYCIRCFHISIKSPNIIITRTAGNPDRCFISLPAAENSCPKVEYLDATRQMILYKSSKEIRKEPCPIDGKYMIQYKQYKIDHSIECISRSSEISNCPVGSELNIHFQDCPFENHDITFECLGSWSGPNSQHYLALFDTRSSEEPRPKYRCGLYLEDSGSGSIYIAFSSDSTCSTDLKSSQVGFETLVLTPYANSQPQMAACRFPTWLQGQWELVSVDGKVFKYTDTTLFKTYTFQCLSYDESDRRYDFPISGDDDKKILVYGKTQCGEELYSCIWAKKRGPNVFEFQLGMFTSPQYNASLCSSSNFQPNTWITQGRQDYLEDSPCPLLGEYVGTIPNAESLCAKLTSDCSSPDTMFYSVSDCTQIIYEDREYRCLGQWQENGLTYTFTQRKHIGLYECFVGSPLSDSKFSIREAGKYCERVAESPLLSMILTKKSSCAENRTITTVTTVGSSFVPTTQTVPVVVTTMRYTPKKITTHSTKAWKPITNITRPQSPFRSKNTNPNNGIKNVPSQLFTVFICFVFIFDDVFSYQ